MNTVYRSLWNPALGAWVAAPEMSRTRRRGGARSVRGAVCALALLGLAGGAFAQAAGGAAYVGDGASGGWGGTGNGGGGGGGLNGHFPQGNGLPAAGGTGGAGGNTNYGALGAGGSGGLPGSASVDSAAITGGNGSNGAVDGYPYGAGGGGGGGAAVHTMDVGIGVAAGTTLTGGNGGLGGTDRLAGGGGGGGAGLASLAADATLTNAGAITGGRGGDGGDGQWAGAGGAGGDGIASLGGAAAITNSGTSTGGDAGGAGGAGAFGGEGGAGLAVQSDGNTVANTGTLAGGAGGSASGVGGMGIRIIGNGNGVLNTGRLAGGLSGDGITYGNAIGILGDGNTVELRAGTSIAGSMVASGADNALVLGGDITDAGTTLAAGGYSGFSRYEKTGTGTWTLTGASTAATLWTIRAGTLAIATDASLGADSGALTLEDGVLQTTASTASNRVLVLGNGSSGGGAIRTDGDTTFTLNGAVTGAGTLTKVGAGTLALAAAGSYTGGTVISEGKLQAAATGALGNGPVTVNAALEFLDGVRAGSLTIINQNGYTTFQGASNAEQASITNNNGSGTDFYGSSRAGSAAIRNNGAAFTYFREGATADHANIVNSGGTTFFIQGATGGQATIDNNGGQTRFYGSSTAGSASIANRNGGLTYFIDDSQADGATVASESGGGVDASYHHGGLVIGALSGPGRLLLGSQAVGLGALGTDTTISGIVSDGGEGGGTGGSIAKLGSGALTLTGANTYTGGTALKQGRVNVGHNSALGTGALAMDDGTTLGFAADGLTLANDIQLTGSADPVIDTGDFSTTLAGAIGGAGFLTKEGSGTLTLTGANAYTGATSVAAGTLRAGAANSFSAASAYTVAAGATLDLAGHSQTVAALTNGGTVSVQGAAPGATLTVNGPFVGSNGLLKLGTALGGSGSVTDRLVLDGAAAASGNTRVQVTNLGGLGALTTGDGIEVISAVNGATTTAQSTKDAFSLAGGHVDAGAFEYRLHAADASGAGESWYLRSNWIVAPVDPAPPVSPVPPVPPVVTVPTYRAEVPLFAAAPEQLRQSDLAMAGNLHQRVGDEAAGAGSRRAWGRVISTDRTIRQQGTVNPASDGRLNGMQAGTDLWADADWRAGLYVGHLEGDMHVDGFARGIADLAAGSNDLRSRYLGAYATYGNGAGFYADGVLQAGRHRYTVSPDQGASVAAKGDSLLVSIEVGQSFGIAPGWALEPQLQLVHQRLSPDDTRISGALVQQDTHDSWTARLGARIKGEVATGAGTLQPYGRLNFYRSSNGTDIARFVGPAASTDIATRTGGSSTELAAGATLAVTSTTSVYGELGKLWASGGDSRTRSGVNAGLGLKVRW
jgi:outer membrane autotransporter protein